MKFHTAFLAELQSNRNAEYLKKTALISEIVVLRARMATSPGDGNAADNRVRAIMGEPVLPDTRPDVATLEAKLRELDLINKSIAIFDGKIVKEKAVASRLLCESETEAVTKRGRAFAEAFVKLHAAQLDYHTHLERIQDTGASIISLPHVFISGLGDARDRSGTFMYGIRDFIEAGYWSAMPKEFQ